MRWKIHWATLAATSGASGGRVERNQIRALAAQWAGLAEYFRQVLSDQVCGWYAADLSDLSYEQVLAAMVALRREPNRRFMPMPADVRERVECQSRQSDSAVEIAGRIRAGIARFGYTHADEAQRQIGAIGWDVVAQMGGWQHLCQTLKTSEMNTFYAQCRDLCQTLLAKKHANQRLGGRPLTLTGGHFTPSLR